MLFWGTEFNLFEGDVVVRVVFMQEKSIFDKGSLCIALNTKLVRIKRIRAPCEDE